LQEPELASLKQFLYPYIPTLESSHCNGRLHTIVKNVCKNYSGKLEFYLFKVQDMSLTGTLVTVCKWRCSTFWLLKHLQMYTSVTGLKDTLT